MNWIIYIYFGVLCEGITELNVEPYDEDEGTGDLRYVQVISEITLKWI